MLGARVGVSVKVMARFRVWVAIRARVSVRAMKNGSVVWRLLTHPMSALSESYVLLWESLWMKFIPSGCIV